MSEVASNVRCEASNTPESPATLSSLTAAETEAVGGVSDIGDKGGDLFGLTSEQLDS